MQNIANLDRDDLDFQLSPSRSASDAAGVLRRCQQLSENARINPALFVRLDVPYGHAPSERMDIFGPAERSSLLPVVVFLHGGFWQEGSRSSSAFAAPAVAAAGQIFVAVGYTLAPYASLTQIQSEVERAVVYLRHHVSEFGGDPSRMTIVGHSAGGHLATCLVSAWGDGGARGPLSIVSISGVFDLEPIRLSYVNDLVHISDAEVASLSPMRQRPHQGTRLALFVGSNETQEFLRQTEQLGQRWRPFLRSMETAVILGRDHFDILLDLCEPTSVLFKTTTTLSSGDPV